jgi:predicted SAM-dependent methyltransferase
MTVSSLAKGKRTTMFYRVTGLVRRVSGAVRRRLPGRRNAHACYICKRTFAEFQPFAGGTGMIPPLVREWKIVGSDVDNFWCPCCHSHDRERHLFMYFDRLSLWEEMRGAVLHFAPEAHVEKAIVGLSPKQYVRGDSSPDRPDITRLDATEIPFPDETFDFIICNHVLEHIPDDRRAIAELHRVLKRGKHAVLQTPYSSVLAQSFEDANINTDEMRLAFYGQSDHVRVYGGDLFSKLEKAGFVLQRTKHADVLSDINSKYYGVNPREELLLVRKE